MRLLVPGKRVCGNLPHSRKLEYTLMFGVKAKSGSRPLISNRFQLGAMIHEDVLRHLSFTLMASSPPLPDFVK